MWFISRIHLKYPLFTCMWSPQRPSSDSTRLSSYSYCIYYIYCIFSACYREILQEIQRLRLQHEEASQPPPDRGQQNPTLLAELRLLRYILTYLLRLQQNVHIVISCLFPTQMNSICYRLTWPYGVITVYNLFPLLGNAKMSLNKECLLCRRVAGNSWCSWSN